MSKRTSLLRLGLLFSILMTALALAPPASASTTVTYQATYVEPYGGPQQSPFSCDAGTTCGSASISHSATPRTRSASSTPAVWVVTSAP